LCGRGCVIEIHIYLYIFSLSVLYLSMFIVNFLFIHVSEMHVYVLIRSLNSLGRFWARGSCAECLKYIYICFGPSSTQPRSPFGCVLVWTRLRNSGTYLSIHILALFYILFSGVP